MIPVRERASLLELLRIMMALVDPPVFHPHTLEYRLASAIDSGRLI
jgi:hypothetical protein